MESMAATRREASRQPGRASANRATPQDSNIPRPSPHCARHLVDIKRHQKQTRHFSRHRRARGGETVKTAITCRQPAEISSVLVRKLGAPQQGVQEILAIITEALGAARSRRRVP